MFQTRGSDSVVKKFSNQKTIVTILYRGGVYVKFQYFSIFIHNHIPTPFPFKEGTFLLIIIISKVSKKLHLKKPIDIKNLCLI